MEIIAMSIKVVIINLFQCPHTIPSWTYHHDKFDEYWQIIQYIVQHWQKKKKNPS